MGAVTRGLDVLEKALVAVCIAAMAIMSALGVATVFFRFVVESSLAFPEELIRYLFVWMILLGSAVALRRNLHAAITIFVNMLPASVKRPVLLAATAVNAFFFGVLIVMGIYLTIRVGPQTSPALEISMAWVYAAVPCGAAFMLINTLETFVRQLMTPVDALTADGT